jgi:Putative addiction module component
MSDETRHLLDEALRLPLADRAEFAAELLASMDGAPDADAEQAWAAEISRRAERAIRGESRGRDANEVLAEIELKLRQR